MFVPLKIEVMHWKLNGRCHLKLKKKKEKKKREIIGFLF